MEDSLPWFRQLPAEQRSWVGLVAQAGIAAFVEWYRSPQDFGRITSDVFGTAPPDLARAITLAQTVEMVRTTIGVMEDWAERLAVSGEEHRLREAVLLYSREIAFAAADVYARAAESRGAWDARLEALVIDSLLAGDVSEAVASRAAALGWGRQAADGPLSGVMAVAGAAPPGDAQTPLPGLRRAAEGHRLDLLSGIHGDVLVVLVAGATDPDRTAKALTAHFGPGPVVVGPLGAGLAHAAHAIAEALAGLRAAPAWPDAPRPVRAIDLLPERVLAGDTRAAQRLVAEIIEPLRREDPVLLETLSAYLERTGSLEATARRLFVHPNTVRHRLRRVADLTGRVASDPRDSLGLRLALSLSRLSPDADPL